LGWEDDSNIPSLQKKEEHKAPPIYIVNPAWCTTPYMMQQKPKIINANIIHCFCSTITAIDAVNKINAEQNIIVGNPTIAINKWMLITADTDVIAISINKLAEFFWSSNSLKKFLMTINNLKDLQFKKKKGSSVSYLLYFRIY